MKNLRDYAFMVFLKTLAQTEEQRAALKLLEEASDGDTPKVKDADESSKKSNNKDGDGDGKKDGADDGDSGKKDGADGKSDDGDGKKTVDSGDEEPPKWAKNLIEKIDKIESESKNRESEVKAKEVLQRAIKQGLVPAKNQGAQDAFLGVLKTNPSAFDHLLKSEDSGDGEGEKAKGKKFIGTGEARKAGDGEKETRKRLGTGVSDSASEAARESLGLPKES